MCPEEKLRAHSHSRTRCTHRRQRRPVTVFSLRVVAPVLPTSKARCGVYFRGLPRFGSIPVRRRCNEAGLPI